jgi:hypothetical protein
MKEVADELKCLKVHDYFLQMHVSEEQNIQMQREKKTRRDNLQKCVDDREYRSTNKSNLTQLTDKLNKHMQARHDDDDDKAIFTLTDYIKFTHILY